jgi:hypothetical protein
VRCSIPRKQPGGETAEVGIDTLFDAGEQVKLKIVPNDRGYLRVWEYSHGAFHSIVSATAQPLRPFEASLPVYPSPGTRLLYVQFTRDARALLTVAPANLIQTTVADEAEKATYVVTNDPATQQLLVPITLNYK